MSKSLPGSGARQQFPGGAVAVTRKLAVFLLLLASAARVSAQGTSSQYAPTLSYSLNVASTNCSLNASCVWMSLPNTATSVSVTVNGTYSGTITVEQSANGAAGPFTSLGTISSTGVSQTFTVSAQTDFRARMSAFTSGVASVTLQLGQSSGSPSAATCAQIANCNILPSGVDTGVVNAMVVNPTPAIASLTFGASFTFTTPNSNTGATTINVSGLGVKNLTTMLGLALFGGEMTGGSTVYAATYDGKEWLLSGSSIYTFAGVIGVPAAPAGKLNLAGSYIIPNPGGSTNDLGTNMTLLSPPANTSGGFRQVLTFLCVPLAGVGCVGTQNTYMAFGFDNDNNFILGGSMGLIAFINPTENFSTTNALANSSSIDNVVVSHDQAPNAGVKAINVKTPVSQAASMWALDAGTGLETVNPQKVFVASDFTDSTTGTLVAITGLSITMPTGAWNASFHCSFMFDQTGAVVSDAFGIGVVTNAPTNVNANGTTFSGAGGAPTSGVLTGLTTTTPTAVVTFTPSAITTIWNAQMDGTVEWPGNATPGVLNFYVSTTTGADNLVVKRDSYCTLF